MTGLQQKTDADIVAVAHYHDIGDDHAIVRNGIPCGIYSGDEIRERMMCTGVFFEYGITPQLYTKLFRADILKKNQMKVDAHIIAGDDAAVVYPSLLDAELICVSDVCGYHYVQHMNSITKNRYNDEAKRIETLITYLRKEYSERNVDDAMGNQLAWYREYLMILRDIEGLDESDKEVLSAFGGVPYGKSIVIYGAGVLGQEIYSYIKCNGKLGVCAWVDKNWKLYHERGMNVSDPDVVLASEVEFDYIIVANITYTTAHEIKKYLISREINEDRIRLLRYMNTMK